MKIGQQLKGARVRMKLTQDEVAEHILVSRQTISNWETGKSYPDIISVIALSDLYHLTLDQLLKGDEAMVKHLEISTNLVASNVASNKKLIIGLGIYLALLFILMVIATILNYPHLMVSAIALLFIGMAIALYQVIKRI